jgi:hypothetical protein
MQASGSMFRLVTVVSVLLLSLVLLSACASGSGNVTRSESYDHEARIHDRVAMDWRDGGHEPMVAYHEQRAATARHNSSAAECGWFGMLLFTVVLNSESCDIK